MQILFYFTGLNILFFIAILCFLNPSLTKQFLMIFSDRKARTVALAIALVISINIYGLHTYMERQEKIRIGERLMTIASTARSQFDPADLDQLHKAGDMKTDAYQRVFKKLNEIRDNSPDIAYIYIMRPTDVPDVWEYVADADSNYNLPFWIDVNNDGILTGEDDENVWPGLAYVGPNPEMLRKEFLGPVHDLGEWDQWGFTITGSAPIFKNGKMIATVEASVLIDG